MSNPPLREAYRLVKEEGMSVRGAAKRCGVPRRTLRDKVTGRFAMDAKRGRRKVFTPEEEMRIVRHVVTMGDWGYGLTRGEIRETASKYAVYYLILQRVCRHLRGLH